MINTAKAFQKILREWGHDVLIQRRLSDDGVYSDRFEKVTTRHITAASRYLASTKEETTEGVIINSDRIYYFAPAINCPISNAKIILLFKQNRTTNHFIFFGLNKNI
jgi:hypothetical protein